MAAALECWSGSRTSTDEDMVEQVLMKTHNRSESQEQDTTKDSPSLSSPSYSLMQKKFQKLSRNVATKLNNIKNSLNLDSPAESMETSSRKIVWGSVVKHLTQLYPGSQLPEKLISNIRKHFDSLPLSYIQAGFDMKDVFLHMKMIEQATVDENPAILIQEVCGGGGDNELQQESVFKLTFVCNSSISWSTMSGVLDNSSICCKKIQIFEKKCFTLGVVVVQVQSGQEKLFKTRIDSVLKSAILKKPKGTSTIKLPFGLCGCQEENNGVREIGPMFGNEEQNYENIESENSMPNVQLECPLPSSSFVVSVDEWQTIQSGGDEISSWLLSSECVEFTDQIGANSFKGVYNGRRVAIEKIRGCERGNAYQFEIRRDLLELMRCGHKCVLQFHGVCIDENHGLCVVFKLMEGGSLHDLILKGKRLLAREIVRISTDVAEGVKFMNDHGVAYRDLNPNRILLDRQGNACLGDMGIVTVCQSMGEVMEYETDGYRWLAPEIIAGDPESVTETWMSNVYSFGMVVWEMVTGEAAYSSLSPVQAAVGIAACGLRPEIPTDCPQTLQSLMTKCWNNCPAKRPQFSEILAILLKPNNKSR
ncbi:hypothetical protein MKW98_007960 [Papaver atlanticum]|uniref:Protein kinase domain-containing protein n=1 Tax=Papaver atlanticum TaxID=357466 RepID=A0AAD4S6P3_9MAGN|nr:hypothetical protein MKW98_007960 [Papaver atlanticum]